MIGSVSNASKNIKLLSCANHGSVTGASYVGGLVGYLGCEDVANPVSVTITNSANNNTISTDQGTACGLLCVSTSVFLNVVNCIDKGNVKGSAAYGITNIVFNADNVVSMGDVTGSDESFAFWRDVSRSESIYCLNNVCSTRPSDATLFEYNSGTESYQVVGGDGHLHELLNDKALSKQYGMVWTSQLELVNNLWVVNVSGEFDRLFAVEFGTSLEKIGNLSHYLNSDEYGIVSCGDSEKRIVYNASSTVSGNISIIVGRWVNVSVSAPINKEKMVVSGEPFEQVARYFNISLVEYIVKNMENVLDSSSVIDSNMELTLNHNVAFTGDVNGSRIVKHGTTFGQIKELSGKLSLPFVVFDSVNKSRVFDADTPVTRHTQVSVIKVSKDDYIIWFDDNADATPDKIKQAIGDLIDISDEEQVWIEVVSQDDNSFIISVIYQEGKSKDIENALRECSKS